MYTVMHMWAGEYTHAQIKGELSGMWQIELTWMPPPPHMHTNTQLLEMIMTIAWKKGKSLGGFFFFFNLGDFFK